MRRQLVLSIFALVLASAAEGAALPADAGATRTLIVAGEASILDGDVAAARDQAFTDARTRAVEAAAGVTVDAENLLVAELPLTSASRLRARGALVAERVIEQGVIPGNLYRVLLEAQVTDDRLADPLIRLAEHERVAVRAHVVGLPIIGAGPRLQARLAGELRLGGWRRVLEDEPPGGAEAILTSQARLDVPTYPGGGLVVVTASAALRLVRRATGETIASVDIAAARGFGDTAARAADAALDELGRRAAVLLAQRAAPDGIRTVRVEVEQLPDLGAFERVRNLLASSRWTESVATDPLGYHPQRTVFLVRTRLDPLSLGAVLDRSGGAMVQQAGEEGIVARWIR